jgi:hypothetical protein
MMAAAFPDTPSEYLKFGGPVELNGRELSWDGRVSVRVVTERHDQAAE